MKRQETGSYPCGCRWARHADGTYTHWAHPACPFDGRKVGNTTIRGYRYVSWSGGRRPRDRTDTITTPKRE